MRVIWPVMNDPDAHDGANCGVFGELAGAGGSATDGSLAGSGDPARAADPGLIVEDVQDYPRPPALQKVPQRLRILCGGRILAETLAALRVLETHHAPTYYLPRGAFADGALAPAGRRSFCEWKGRAHYLDLDFGGYRTPAAAWDYPDPTPAFRALLGHVAIYAGAVDEAWVGGARVTPQPGDFYGGWVTPNLTGIVKGAAGTEGW